MAEFVLPPMLPTLRDLTTTTLFSRASWQATLTRYELDYYDPIKLYEGTCIVIRPLVSNSKADPKLYHFSFGEIPLQTSALTGFSVNSLKMGGVYTFRYAGGIFISQGV
ncbi:hypothetical protein AWU65_07070 [Paenibacillus glucanolyticus]|uniref:Uncharacterized protein n=1 Tax=Paenibacillus glucanolyticus TaxID=59843 RepID=A0A163HVW2_9BACL|nr:hypothetical protein [Paenibacillus glucanolyticus]KZS45689.1 hypothetical protein AWU65_07070 [Paenibacillus glucanolyticus]